MHPLLQSSQSSSSEKGISAVNAPYGRWTDSLVERLRKCFAAKMTGEETAAELGFTRNAIIGKLNRLGLKRHAEGRHPRAGTFGSSQPRQPRPHLRIIRVEGPIASSRNLELIDLGPTDCRFPYGDGPFVFCGAPCADKSSYCAHHHQLCWTPPKERQ